MTNEKREDLDMTDGISKFLLLQVNDALFPIGGYSHSYGLETYIQKGIVKDADSAGSLSGNAFSTISFIMNFLLSVWPGNTQQKGI